MTKKIFDVAVIGGGPVGIFTAFYAAMRDLQTVLIESMPTLGGQPSNLYAQKKIYDVAGKFGVSGAELTKSLLVNDDHFTYETCLETTVQNFEKLDDCYRIITNQQNDFYARAIIVTIGNGPFKPRKLAFDYDSALEGKQLNYFVKDINEYHDCDVLVAGGGDAAVDWALEIDKVAHTTYLLHRREQFRALESSVRMLNSSKVKLLTPNIITGIQRNLDSEKLTVTYKTVGDKTINQIVVDKLLVNYGMTNDSRLLRQWGLNLQGPFITVNSQMQTNLPQVYGAGDAIIYPGKQRLIALGFAEGPIAVNSAIEELYPQKTHFGHSSSMFN